MKQLDEAIKRLDKAIALASEVQASKPTDKEIRAAHVRDIAIIVDSLHPTHGTDAVRRGNDVLSRVLRTEHDLETFDTAYGDCLVSRLQVGESTIPSRVEASVVTKSIAKELGLGYGSDDDVYTDDGKDDDDDEDDDAGSQAVESDDDEDMAQD